MKLYYRKIGEGQPLIILHGLFGQSDNWNTLGKKIAEQGYEVYLVDLRNHGNSPHSMEWNYPVMSADVSELINDLKLSTQKVILLGHSMGGKVGMCFAMQHAELLSKLIVVDIAPKFHLPDNDDVMQAINAIDFKGMKSRKEAELVLSKYIKENGIIQFLLKNIQWKDTADGNPGELEWKFYKEGIVPQIKNISEDIKADSPCPTETLFIRGEKSHYILDEDIEPIKAMFPQSYHVTIPGAGHWVHVDKPLEFLEEVMKFIK